MATIRMCDDARAKFEHDVYVIDTQQNIAIEVCLACFCAIVHSKLVQSTLWSRWDKNKRSVEKMTNLLFMTKFAMFRWEQRTLPAKQFPVNFCVCVFIIKID